MRRLDCKPAADEGLVKECDAVLIAQSVLPELLRQGNLRVQGVVRQRCQFTLDALGIQSPRLRLQLKVGVLSSTGKRPVAQGVPRGGRRIDERKLPHPKRLRVRGELADPLDAEHRLFRLEGEPAVDLDRPAVQRRQIDRERLLVVMPDKIEILALHEPQQLRRKDQVSTFDFHRKPARGEARPLRFLLHEFVD